MLTEKQLREIDEHYLKFTIFGRTFSWFNTSPLRIYNHIQRVKKSVDLANVVGQSEQLADKPYCNKCGDYVGSGCDNEDCKDFKG
jgi:hypothetical protein